MRLQQGQLLHEERAACRDLCRLGVSITRRPVFQDIANEDVFALELDGLEDLGQQIAGASDERQARRIFSGTRCFTNANELGLGVSVARN